MALVSDAGTPLLSDPGFALVRAAVAHGIEVRAVPGASALTAALSIAGLPIDRFAFEGFLPARSGERRAATGAAARRSAHAGVLRSATSHRRDARGAGGDCSVRERPAVIARELTKLHETVYRGTLGELARRAQSDPNMARGEITLLVGGCAGAPRPEATAQLLARALKLLLAELPPARAAAIAAQLAGVPRSEAYALAQQLRARPQAELAARSVVEPSGRAIWCSAESRPGSRCAVSIAEDVEESPGSAGKVPGNAWGARAHGKCNRE